MHPSFYHQPTPKLAQALLGQTLEHQTAAGLTAGRIVETEAYLGSGDLASHSARGITRRNAVMFGPPGLAYIYFTYGMHWLFNVTAGPIGAGEAVLIRALEPLDGIELMQQRRGRLELKLLCSGPAKLTQALGIRPDQNGADLARGALRIRPHKGPGIEIITRPRIGIRLDAERPLRFYIKGNSYVSKI